MEDLLYKLLGGDKEIIKQYTFNEFLEYIDINSDKSVCWKYLELDNDKKLYLFTNEWYLKMKNTDYITKYLDSLIIDTDFNVYMFGGHKVYDSNRDNISLDDVKPYQKMYKAYEGTTINVWFNTLSDKWMYSTKKCFDMNKSNFANKKSHGEMFNEIVKTDDLEKELNKNYTYHFVLVHADNSHLLQNENKLVLTAVRDKNNSFQKLSENIIISNTVLPEEVSEETFLSWNQDAELSQEAQGVIVINDLGNIYRMYTKSYSKKLVTNPKFNSYQEKLIWDFKNNKLENNEKYNITVGTIKFVNFCLFLTVMHFTEFPKSGDQKFIQKSSTDYDKIKFHNGLKRHLYKLQRVPYAVKTFTKMDLRQVSYHVKQICPAQDINLMYRSFLSLIENQVSWLQNVDKKIVEAVSKFQELSE
jgi:hypothetical protein